MRTLTHTAGVHGFEREDLRLTVCVTFASLVDELTGCATYRQLFATRFPIQIYHVMLKLILNS